MDSFAYNAVDDELVVFVTGSGALADAEWQSYARHVDTLAQRARALGHPIGFLTFTHGEAAPNAKQRAEIAEILRGVQHRTAVMTDATFARHVITVFGWLNFSVRGFAPGAIVDASNYLGLSPARLDAALAAALSLAPLVGGSPSIEAAARARHRATG